MIGIRPALSYFRKQIKTGQHRRLSSTTPLRLFGQRSETTPKQRYDQAGGKICVDMDGAEFICSDNIGYHWLLKAENPLGHPIVFGFSAAGGIISFPPPRRMFRRLMSSSPWGMHVCFPVLSSTLVLLPSVVGTSSRARTGLSSNADRRGKLLTVFSCVQEAHACHLRSCGESSIEPNDGRNDGRKRQGWGKRPVTA